MISLGSVLSYHPMIILAEEYFNILTILPVLSLSAVTAVNAAFFVMLGHNWTVTDVIL